MLQQQAQLFAGIQETYRHFCAADAWPDAALDERGGRPLTHHIPSALEIIHHKGKGQMLMFAEDPEKLQQRLIAHGGPFLHRRESVSSDSGHSTTHSSTASMNSMQLVPAAQLARVSMAAGLKIDATSASMGEQAYDQVTLQDVEMVSASQIDYGQQQDLCMDRNSDKMHDTSLTAAEIPKLRDEVDSRGPQEQPLCAARSNGGRPRTASQAGYGQQQGIRIDENSDILHAYSIVMADSIRLRSEADCLRLKKYICAACSNFLRA